MCLSNYKGLHCHIAHRLIVIRINQEGGVAREQDEGEDSEGPIICRQVFEYK